MLLENLALEKQISWLQVQNPPHILLYRQDIGTKDLYGQFEKQILKGLKSMRICQVKRATLQI